MVNFLKIFEKFFCTDCVGHSNCVSVFALTGRLLSLHRLSGVRELLLACSPLTGGSFFAEPQPGTRRTRGGGAKRVDTYGFYPL